jgi:phosphoserine aminotransferase
MGRRVTNLNPGPAILPVEVLENAQAELVDFGGTGMSLLEMSHRGEVYEGVHRETMAAARRLTGAPDDFEVLLLQGGATLQFSMVPLNLLGGGGSANYVLTGSWSRKALSDASRHGDVTAAWEQGAEPWRLPDPADLDVDPESRYLHITSNETIDGVQWRSFPDIGVPLVADMSSDYMSRPIPWDLFDLVYGGTQKNLGPAGLTVVFVRRRILDSIPDDLGSALRYDTHAAASSLANTPPVAAVWLTGLVLAWIERQGGIAEMERRASGRAGLVYEAIDRSEGFFHGPVARTARSLMNVVFRLPTAEQERQFVTGAAERGIVGLAGHRCVGGIRASLYNALPLEAAELLVDWMEQFRAGTNRA